ncbi:MAG: hypothetical protein FGF52_05335 [Candidatus Brockarchaeota archaeon]|nr:hypothetical protein [Candidatus Brockarchaeota archaeon]
MFLYTLLSTVIPVQTQEGSTIPSSNSWNNLRIDSVQISYSFSKVVWEGSTGYLHIDARTGPGEYSDTKSATARITVPEGVCAEVYVCGDDRTSMPTGWVVKGKYLKVYVDGKEVYKDIGYWWANCYTKAATIGPGTHTVKLQIYIRVNVTSSFREYDLHYAILRILFKGNGTIQAESHSAEATLDGEATHVFAFRLPEISGVTTIDWKAVWKGVEKKGKGSPGSLQEVSFKGSNRDSWVFSSPVIVKVGDPVPSVQPVEGYVIDVFYHDGTREVGIRRIAVAVNNGDEVGFTSGKYLVTAIEYLGFYSTGCTYVEDSNAWANSGSTVHWAQRVRFYDSDGWVTENANEGVETGSCFLKRIGGGVFSRKVSFSSKNRVDEETLTISLPEITLHFDSMKAEPIGPTDLGLHRIGEIIELKVKTLDCLGEYSRIDVYRVSESSPGVRVYEYAPLTGVYRGITSVVGGNVTFRIRWVFLKLAISSVSGATLNEGAYWAKSGSRIKVVVSAFFPDDGSPAKGVRLRDSEGNEAFTGPDGTAVFSYVKSNCESYLSYVAVDEQGNKLSEEIGIKIIFSNIMIETFCNETCLGGVYYACNDAYASVKLRATYSHNNMPAAGAVVRFRPTGFSASINSEGFAELKLTGRNAAYEGLIEVSNGAIGNNAVFKIVFTDIVLEPSKDVLRGRSGDVVNVTVFARLTFNNMLLNGVKVKWADGGIVKETPAVFELKIPQDGFLKTKFEAICFLPCVKPCEVILYSDSGMVKKGLTFFPDLNHSYEFMLNIGDLLNLTIPKVIWSNNGSIAYGVRMGVVSSNGTLIRIGIVSERGVSFNWTEFKPGVYYYSVKPLDESIDRDVLNIKAVFTAFNITGNYIVDFNNTHVLFATVRWAHNNSIVKGLPVHTSFSNQRALSDRNGVVRISFKDSDYNTSCLEKITVWKSDPHPSGIWKTIGECSVKIVKLDWSNTVVTGDQYGLYIMLNLTGYEYAFPISVRVEGYSPELSSLIRILRVKSDNSSMTIFIKPTRDISLREVLALRIEEAKYNGVRIKVKVKSLSKNLIVRNVKIKILNSTLEKSIGDMSPGSLYETVLEIPEELRTNPITLAVFSENTIPHVVKVWEDKEVNPLAPISILPLLVALVLRLRNRNKDSEKSRKEVDNSAKNEKVN